MERRLAPESILESECWGLIVQLSRHCQNPALSLCYHVAMVLWR